MDALKMLPMVGRLRDLMPKTVKDAPCQEVVASDGTLDELPILTCWPEDGGRYHHASAGLHEGSGNRHAQHRHLSHAGVRRPHDRHALAAAQGRRAALPRSRSGWASASKWPSRSVRNRCCHTARPRRCPRASTSCCSAAFWRGDAIEMVKCVTVDLEVPASSHIVLEGYVEPGERRREGPFGDHTGFYSQPDDFPVFHLTCVTRRKQPDLSDDGRRRAADGGLLPRAGERAHLPADDPEDAAGDRRHALSGRRHLPQPRASSRSTSGIPGTRARS